MIFCLEFIEFTSLNINEEESIAGMLILRGRGDILVSTSRGKIFKTSDFGKNWMCVECGILTRNPLKFLSQDRSDILCAKDSNGVVIKSFDYGDTWEFSRVSLWEQVRAELEKAGIACNKDFGLLLDLYSVRTAINAVDRKIDK